MTTKTIAFRWFSDSPDIGRHCICSVCGHPITKGVPVRVYDESRNMEARFHIACYNEVSSVVIDPGDEDYGEE